MNGVVVKKPWNCWCSEVDISCDVMRLSQLRAAALWVLRYFSFPGDDFGWWLLGKLWLSKKLERYVLLCIYALMESVELVVSECFHEYAWFEHAVRPSCNESQVCSSYGRGAVFNHFIWEGHGWFVSLLLFSSVYCLLSITKSEHLGCRPGPKGATKVKRLPRQLAQFWAVDRTASKARFCLCSNTGVLERVE